MQTPLAGRARTHASVPVKHSQTCATPPHAAPIPGPAPSSPDPRAARLEGARPPQVVYLWIGWARRLLHTDEVRAYRARLAREGDAPTPKRK